MSLLLFEKVYYYYYCDCLIINLNTLVSLSGVKENMLSLNMGAEPELPRALSLLSNKSSSEPESTSIGHPTHVNSIGHPTHVNQISITEQVIPENLPLGSTDLWQAEQYLLNPRIHALVANGYSGGSFQLSKDPFDNFYFNGLS